MSIGSDRRKFDAAWLAANDDRTPDGQRAECFRFMAQLSQKYDTRAWKAELEAKHGPAQQTQQPAGQQSAQQQEPPEPQATGREYSRADFGAEWDRFDNEWIHANPRGWTDGEYWSAWHAHFGHGGHAYAGRKPPRPTAQPRRQYRQAEALPGRARRARPRRGATAKAARPAGHDTTGAWLLFFVMAAGGGSLFAILAGAVVFHELGEMAASPAAAIGSLGLHVGFLWHRRDLVLQTAAVMVGILSLRSIGNCRSTGELVVKFCGGLALGMFLFWLGGVLIGPPL